MDSASAEGRQQTFSLGVCVAASSHNRAKPKGKRGKEIAPTGMRNPAGYSHLAAHGVHASGSGSGSGSGNFHGPGPSTALSSLEKSHTTPNPRPPTPTLAIVYPKYLRSVITHHQFPSPPPPNRSILPFSVFQFELISALYRAIRARFRCIRKAVGVSYHRFLALIIIHRRISPNSCLTLSGLGRRLAAFADIQFTCRPSMLASSGWCSSCCHYRRTRNLSSLGLLIPLFLVLRWRRRFPRRARSIRQSRIYPRIPRRYSVWSC